VRVSSSLLFLTQGHHTQLLTPPGDSSEEGTSFWPGLSDISGEFRHARNLGRMERPKIEYGVPGTPNHILSYGDLLDPVEAPAV
jgi:hypothetical protein